MKKNLVALAVLASLFGASQAQAFDLGVAGVYNISMPSSDPEVENQVGGGSIGFGVTAQHEVAPQFTLELDVLFVSFKSGVEVDADNSAIATVSTLQIPLIAKYWVAPMFSVGAGLYYGTALGDGSLTTTTGGTETESDFTLTDDQKTEFGVVLAVGAKTEIAPQISLGGDVRYLLDLTDSEPSDDASAKANALQILVGVSYAL